ncbi:MAG TPA: alpha/beta fold hydrolase [Acidimicrobiia bacterium]|nr:alpha/beta fold hydrolase [Acidimicrobiia bacterium]
MSATRMVGVDGLSIHVADHGSVGDPVVLMIHGWPDTGNLWRHQVPALTGAGYRVLTPDTRGMGLSGRPAEVEGYRARTCVADMIAVLDDAGTETAHVVAHDWGAAVGWGLAIGAPQRVRTLTALSVGHPNSFAAAGLRQLQRSWYMLLFQFEGIAEEWLSADDWAGFRRFMGGHPETERWIANLSGDGALESSLNWYRANAHPSRLVAPSRPAVPCRVPTLGVWSDGDFALTEQQMQNSGQYVEGPWRYERIDGASHWIPLDAPDRLNGLLLEWLAQSST